MEYILLFLGIFITSFGQVFLKKGVVSEQLVANPKILLQILSNKFLLLGFILYGIGAIMWLFILKKIPLSIAYPAVSMSYIVVIILSAWFFREHINLFKIASIFFIFLGLLFLARSA